jgi:carboxyvinyl-carboxyphosphonate phosphorylmutase
MHWTDRRQKFRAVLAGDICVHPGSVHDPISARIAEDLGFELGMFAGSIGSFTVLGVPDLIVMTLTEFAAQAYRINRAGNLPLMVDADHGYGNALNVMRTVQELETAGVGGLSIEDTNLPRPFNEPKPVLLSIAEGIGKMRAAVAARQDPLLSIFARTSAPGITGTADTIERIKAYSQTGVDAIFLVGVKDRQQLDAISEHTHLPIMMGGLQGDLVDKGYLASRKVRIALQGHQPFSASVQAIYNTLKALREGVAPKDLTGIASAALMKQVTRETSYDGWTREFLEG